MARNFLFTSYNEGEPTFNKDLHGYMIFQQEKCPTTGRLHWQGCVQYITRTSKKMIKIAKECNANNILKCKGTLKQNIAYCSKEESRISKPKEFGVPEFHGVSSVKEEIKSALECKNLKDVDGPTFVKFGRGIKDYRLLHSEKRNWKTEVYILWGQAGAGKSMHLDKNAYWKPANKWWDGYDGEEVVNLDDWDEKIFDREYMLRITDRYPMMVETKGGSINFNPKLICITANTNPWNWYNGDAAWRRRITFINQEGLTV